MFRKDFLSLQINAAQFSAMTLSRMIAKIDLQVQNVKDNAQ